MDVSDWKEGRKDVGICLQLMCAEAQADGVPCPDRGRDCAACERALAHARELRAAEGGFSC
jgi:hypothetical protein